MTIFMFRECSNSLKSILGSIILCKLAGFLIPSRAVFFKMRYCQQAWLFTLFFLDRHVYPHTARNKHWSSSWLEYSTSCFLCRPRSVPASAKARATRRWWNFHDQLRVSLAINSLTYVCRRRKDRYYRMDYNMRLLGLKYTHFPAVDGKTLTQAEIDRMGIKQLPGFSDPHNPRTITRGEVSFYLAIILYTNQNQN